MGVVVFFPCLEGKAEVLKHLWSPEAFGAGHKYRAA